MKSFNIIRFPKNLASIGKASAFRDFCLKPLGLQTGKTSLFPREQKVEKFVNHEMVLHRPEKPMDNKTLTFKCSPKLTKPELHQFFTQVYGFKVNKVHTLNYMGRIKRSPFGKRMRRSDFKKVYLELETEVDPYFQKTEK
eukprot:TRINITY_DN2553_c0_g1_i1.p1 TRINITY_DN2553_c0_g1~~TRINITY_DN2553_c0_g1_i1.p1  ORF type:complete len:140 (-),score=36.41 TRINITY_DN2553_c0_g1_i1:126-545(-)